MILSETSKGGDEVDQWNKLSLFVGKAIMIEKRRKAEWLQ